MFKVLVILFIFAWFLNSLFVDSFFEPNKGLLLVAACVMIGLILTGGERGERT